MTKRHAIAFGTAAWGLALICADPAVAAHDASPAAGPVQKGKASIYAHSLKGRKMADGQKFEPSSDTVASKTLPLGTKAQVTNLKNGRSTTVTVRDHGPNVPGRILDVSPSNADDLGMKHDGVAEVAVKPISKP